MQPRGFRRDDFSEKDPAQLTSAHYITPMTGPYSVLVFDVAHTHDDGEHVVSGFATLDDARLYARRRSRASLEELRKPGLADAELRRLWYLYGEDCKVMGDGYSGARELDRFIAEPAQGNDINWTALTPRSET